MVLEGVPPVDDPRLLAIGNLGDILPSASISIGANGISGNVVLGELFEALYEDRLLLRGGITSDSTTFGF
jgi:hypothetical protein